MYLKKLNELVRMACVGDSGKDFSEYSAESDGMKSDLDLYGFSHSYFQDRGVVHREAGYGSDWRVLEDSERLKIFQKSYGDYDLRVQVYGDSSEVLEVPPGRYHSPAPSFFNFRLPGMNRMNLGRILNRAEKLYLDYRKGRMKNNRGHGGYSSEY